MPGRFLIIYLRIYFILALGLISCASEIKTVSPAQKAGMQASTIAVAPLNMALALPPQLESSTEIVDDAISQHLETRDKNIERLGYRFARSLWIESTKRVGQARGEPSFESGVKEFAKLVSSQVEFDALIIPTLYLQNAKAGPRTTHWDSAKQQIEFIGRSRWEIEMPALSTVPAASIHIYVVDRMGNMIHSRRTGIELIQHMEIHHTKRKGRDKRVWTLTDDDPAIEDPVRVRAAIAHALAPFLQKSN